MESQAEGSNDLLHSTAAAAAIAAHDLKVKFTLESSQLATFVQLLSCGVSLIVSAGILDTFKNRLDKYWIRNLPGMVTY
ncbi:hypothetical protein FHG87_020247 [Trinorchestia longiramus]|nr:hypothetical protein FHG87_020247 [Trinorchestia longiramus]